ncbi:hypothetical protein [Flavobacterium sp. H122]|uniref:hypothetical protein n=1 Tax=Flavobacterium sp. H122 TaxID=2529860 RepID=UPI0010AA4DFF|nr:hypothetical protein [Flavobacterium sp. H122]
MSLTDFLIAFSIIMMMLSFISERASNFIKLYFQSKKIYIPFIYIDKNQKLKWFLSAELQILAYKQPTEGGEKEREYRVMIINIIIGIIIAALTNANFFEIIKKITSSTTNKDVVIIEGWLMDDIDKAKIIGFFYLLTFLWSLSLMFFNKLQENNTVVNQYYVRTPFLLWFLFTILFLILSGGEKDTEYLKIINHTIGYVFVGVFLSLGSKFWHDLLDLLFKFKNTQQALSENKTFTDYDTADKVMARAETSQYSIVEGLYGKYEKEIKTIKGVVSHGIHTLLDERSKLYIKIIEVEFTTPEAQDELDQIKFSGSITINYNVFYLKDYLQYKRTSRLIAVSSIDSSPICYAHNANIYNTNQSRGSFSVYKDGNEYFAISNLHVFADDEEFKNFEDNPNHKLSLKMVRFVVGDNNTHTGEIIDYKFGQYDSYGFDLCICKIEKALYDLFKKQIDIDKLIDIDEYSMSMYGAFSKKINFHAFRSPTTCYVEYEGFTNTKELYLFKIASSSPGIQNISKGDSGSTVYYKIKDKNTVLLARGIIVAKSDDYAYIFREEPLTNTNKLELWKN